MSINKNHFGLIKIFLLVVFFLCLGIKNYAAPQTPFAPQMSQIFYGNLLINGAPAPKGTDVVIFSNEKICGRYLTQIEGRYGVISCNSNSFTQKNSPMIRFEVNSLKADATYRSSEEVDLTLVTNEKKIPEKISNFFWIALIILLIAITAYLILKELKKRK